MSSTNRGDAFDLIRRILRTRGLTYADLAEGIGVSEPTIKRLFVERDCKISRLEAICNWLDLSLNEVLAIAHRLDKPLSKLSPTAEQRLADSPSLFHFFCLLLDGVLPASIASRFALDEIDLYLYSRELEKLDLISLGSDDQPRLRFEAPLQLNLSGPLKARYIALNLAFVEQCLQSNATQPVASPSDQTQDMPFTTLSRRMRAASARLVQQETQALIQRIAQLARQDQLFSDAEDLQSYKWTFAAAQVDLTSLMQIEPHPERGKQR